VDLNEAMAAARNGGKVRDELNMRPDWAMMFFADANDHNMSLGPQERKGLFYYLNPKGEKAHVIMFTDAHRSSAAWRTVP
jgi:hypothetical protein